jgi:type VI secretion system protein ImpD
MKINNNTVWLTKLNTLNSEDPLFLQQALSLLAEFDQDLVSSLTAETFPALIITLIAEIDSALSNQLSKILQHTEFTSLEARWRGLSNLVSVPFNKNRIKIKCLDFDWNTISNDVNLSSSLKRSQLYNKVGNKELNTLGGEPFGTIIIDHQVSAELTDYSDYDDLYTLELLGALGQICLCPFILSPDETFFGEAGAQWLTDTHRVQRVVDGPDYQSWQKLRGMASSRFIGLAMPKVKLRSLYKNHGCGFLFNEISHDKQKGLYGLAHFPFVSTIIREFNRISWFGFLKSRWNDRLQGAVINLPDTGVQHDWLTPQPKVRLFGNIAQFYAKLGFIPLAHSPLTKKYYFMDNHSVWSGQNTGDDKVLSLIQTTLICCRIAHYLKVQIRDVLGSFLNANECELHLSKWLSKYVSNVSSANDETLSKYPLRSAKVSVKESDHTPGEFSCEVYLQPQYQFDMFAGQILLTTELGEGS